MQRPPVQSIICPPLGKKEQSMAYRAHVLTRGMAGPCQTALGRLRPLAGARPRAGGWGLAGSLLLLALLLPAPGFAVVGALSCVGKDACVDNTGTVGSISCTGENACRDNGGTVGNISCHGKEACAGNAGVVGNISCHGVVSQFG